MMENMTFYKRLETLILLSNQSFNKVERELGYPRNALNNYKKGVEPSGTRLIELAHYFGVTPEYLLGVEEEKSLVSLDLSFHKLDNSQKKELSKICCTWFINTET